MGSSGVPWDFKINVLVAAPHWAAPRDAQASCAAEPNPFHESWCPPPALRALDPKGTAALLRFEFDGELAGILPRRREERCNRWPNLGAIPQA